MNITFPQIEAMKRTNIYLQKAALRSIVKSLHILFNKELSTSNKSAIHCNMI